MCSKNAGPWQPVCGHEEPWRCEGSQLGAPGGQWPLTWHGFCSDPEALLMSCLKRSWLVWWVSFRAGDIQPFGVSPSPSKLSPGKVQTSCWLAVCAVARTTAWRAFSKEKCPSVLPPFSFWASLMFPGSSCSLDISPCPQDSGGSFQAPLQLRCFLTPPQAASSSAQGQGSAPVVSRMTIACNWDRAWAARNPTDRSLWMALCGHCLCSGEVFSWDKAWGFTSRLVRPTMAVQGLEPRHRLFIYLTHFEEGC